MSCHGRAVRSADLREAPFLDSFGFADHLDRCSCFLVKEECSASHHNKTTAKSGKPDVMPGCVRQNQNQQFHPLLPELKTQGFTPPERRSDSVPILSEYTE